MVGIVEMERIVERRYQLEERYLLNDDVSGFACSHRDLRNLGPVQVQQEVGGANHAVGLESESPLDGPAERGVIRQAFEPDARHKRVEPGAGQKVRLIPGVWVQPPWHLGDNPPIRWKEGGGLRARPAPVRSGTCFEHSIERRLDRLADPCESVSRKTWVRLASLA